MFFDWRNSVARDVAAMMPEVDALAFATAWRAQYDPAMARIRNGRRGYIALDELHLENLHIVCRDFGVTCPDPEGLNRAWERLDPWPDVVTGLNAMHSDYILAPCSNGSIALMARLARYANLPWDAIVGAELAQDYKPKPGVYLSSCAALRLPPDQVMMVAAHNNDLFAARAAGLQTCFVPRCTEHGRDQQTDLEAEAEWDIIAQDFNDFGRQLGVKSA